MTEPSVAQSIEPSLAQTFRHLRESEFPWTAETTYLDNASIGPIPERTRRVIDAFTARRTAPYLLPDRDLQEILSQARDTLARLIHADATEIGLTTNTGFGLHLAARALPLRRGDVVLVPDKEFPANVYPWLLLEAQGVQLELAPPTPEGWPDEAYLLERLNDPRVRVLAISLVHFANGYRVDLDALGRACRANGAFLVVDGIQGVGQIPIDVHAVPVDILACGGQKWLMSPWGSGFVYVRRELLELLEPVVTGWMAFEGTDDFTHLTDYDRTFRRDARRFEMTTLAFQDFVGMRESASMLLELGIERVAAYLRLIREPLSRRVNGGQLRLASPTDPTRDSSIVCVVPEHPAEAFHHLKKNSVVCSLREGMIRLSPHCYNTVEELERVVAVLCGA